jgi:hypothetical protein
MAAPIQALSKNMDKHQVTGQKLGRVFNSRSGCVHAGQFHCFETKLPNLMLKSRTKQLSGYLPLDDAAPVRRFSSHLV